MPDEEKADVDKDSLREANTLIQDKIKAKEFLIVFGGGLGVGYGLKSKKNKME